MNNRVAQQMIQFAERFAGDEIYLAHVLRQYKEQEGLNSEAFMERFGLTPLQYGRLAMCKRPESGAQFATRTRQIADYVGVAPELLASIVRTVDAVVGLQHLPAPSKPEAGRPRSSFAAKSVLAATRERDERNDTDEEE